MKNHENLRKIEKNQIFENFQKISKLRKFSKNEKSKKNYQKYEKSEKYEKIGDFGKIRKFRKFGPKMTQNGRGHISVQKKYFFENQNNIAISSKSRTDAFFLSLRTLFEDPLLGPNVILVSKIFGKMGDF